MNDKTAQELLGIVIREYGLERVRQFVDSYGVTRDTLLVALDNIRTSGNKKIARICLAKQVLGCDLRTAKAFVDTHYPS